MKRRHFIGAGMVAGTGLLTSCFGISEQQFLEKDDQIGGSDKSQGGGSDSGDDGEPDEGSTGDDTNSGSDGDSGSDGSPDDGDKDGDSGSDGSPDDEDSDGSSGDETYTIETSASEIDQGEDYTVEITVQAGGEQYENRMILTYQTEDDSDWSKYLQDTDTLWEIPAGESETKSFTVKPEETGNLKFGLLSNNHVDVVKTWNLTVNP